MLTKKDLAGEWQLQSFNLIKAEQKETPWRKNTHGILIYTLSNYMSVSINGGKNENLLLPENKYNNILFYAGTYEVSNNKITHFVTNASDPTRIGKNMVREATLDGAQLKLITKTDFGRVALIWERITASKENHNLLCS